MSDKFWFTRSEKNSIVYLFLSWAVMRTQERVGVPCSRSYRISHHQVTIDIRVIHLTDWTFYSKNNKWNRNTYQVIQTLERNKIECCLVKEFVRSRFLFITLDLIRSKRI